MTYTMFTAGVCPRCKIAKRYMDEHGLAYEEIDLKAGGMDAFREFYAANRQFIRRVGEGVEFPVFTDGTVVKQGVGLVIALLQSGDTLDAFLRPSDLGKGWIDGLVVSGGDPSLSEPFVALLKVLKANELQTQLDTDGRNADLLATILDEQLGDRVLMEVATSSDADATEVDRSLALVPQFPEHAFTTTLAEADADAVGRTAERIKTVTGSSDHTYTLKATAGISDRDLLACLDAAQAHLPQATMEKR